MTKYGAPIADDYSKPRAEMMTNHNSNNAETTISSDYNSPSPTPVAPLSTSYGVPTSDAIGQYSEYDDYPEDDYEQTVATSSYGVSEASSPISTSYGLPSAEPITNDYSASQAAGDYDAPPPAPVTPAPNNQYDYEDDSYDDYQPSAEPISTTYGVPQADPVGPTYSSAPAPAL